VKECTGMERGEGHGSSSRRDKEYNALLLHEFLDVPTRERHWLRPRKPLLRPVEQVRDLVSQRIRVRIAEFLARRRDVDDLRHHLLFLRLAPAAVYTYVPGRGPRALG